MAGSEPNFNMALQGAMLPYPYPGPFSATRMRQICTGHVTPARPPRNSLFYPELKGSFQDGQVFSIIKSQPVSSMLMKSKPGHC